MSKRDEIKEYVANFVEGFTKLLRQAGHETVDNIFAAEDVDADGAPPPKLLKGKAKRMARAPKRSNGTADKQNGASLQADVLAIVKANPGTNAVAVAKQIGTSPWTARAALRDLISRGKVRKNGAGAGTSYTAGR